MKYKASDYCPNCHYPLPYKANFCARCGQKDEQEVMSLGALLKQVWFRILHLESRSLLFLGQMFIPGFVSQEFFAGRRKRYPHPIRFFFIVAFLFLFTLNHLTDASESSGVRASSDNGGIKFTQPQDRGEKINFYETGRRAAEFEKMRREFDSLPPELKTPATRKAVDSLLQRTYGQSAEKFSRLLSTTEDSTQANSPDSMSLNLGFKNIRMATSDVFLMEADAIADKYKLDHWLDRVLLKQGIKAIQTPDALMKAYLGSLAWTVLALIALLSAVLTLLYRRQKRFYVEHFIFLINEHTGAFLVLILAFCLNAVWPLGGYWALPVIWLTASPFVAMRRFYGQGWGLTILKATVFSFAYLIGFALLFTLGMLAVFVVF
ncbi:MAG: DUF3667 domain-containing protein [Saprospiraceae bacterium]